MGERLGVGGMAEVFSAESGRFGQIALKRILPGLAQDDDFADMFWDEARMTSRLNHPNIVRILDYGRIDGQLYMALEYVGGPTLARVLRKAARAKTPLGLSVLLGIVVDLLDALHYVHTARDERGGALGIIHRDVSPGNVMLTEEGQVKLADFGIIRSEAVMRRTQPGELKGKMGYMSPEQALGGTVTAKSDLFSVGIILAEFLTLRPLFLGKNEMHTLSRTVEVDLATWHRYNQSVPQELKAIVERALHPEAQHRFQDARTMADALRLFAAREKLDMDPAARQEKLQELELLPGAQKVSGERRITRPQRASELSEGPNPGSPTSYTENEVVTLVEVPAVSQRAGSTMKPHGKALWKVEFSRASLPTKLFSAFRRAPNGVCELHEKGGKRLLSIELRGGNILAVHDSDGLFPLGRLLQEASILSSSELATAIGESRRSKMRLGQYLVKQGRLRESTLVRLLAKQADARLGSWLGCHRGSLSVYPAGGPAHQPQDGDPASVASLVGILRGHLNRDALNRYLAPVADAVVLPAHGVSVPPPGLTDPELRALRTTMHGGAFEGHSLRAVVEGVEEERIARRDEILLALLVGLSSATVLATGFGRDEEG